MFDRIAPVYDVMNHLMTAGLDRRWRREAAQAVVRPGDRVLDACCGTGDLALACVRAGAGGVVGLDFAEDDRACAAKSTAVEWVEGDALAAASRTAPSTRPRSDSALRNVEDRARALGSFRGVLCRGGRVAILEIVRPSGRCRSSTRFGSSG